MLIRRIGSLCLFLHLCPQIPSVSFSSRYGYEAISLSNFRKSCPLRNSDTEHTKFCTIHTSLPMTALIKDLSDWQFSPSSVLQHDLPIDPIHENYLRPDVKGAVFSRVLPTPLSKDVKVAIYSKQVLMDILDMDPSITETREFVDWVAGRNILNSSIPLAHRYGGHQFGYWASQLGDGRAISLGEYVSKNGKRWDIQLKGSGLTPYSRGGDGRAVIRSSVREFLCSEAMHALGVPTSRAAALVVSEDPVIRDQFYQGQPQIEKAAIVMRIAPNWLRFGSLEILAHHREHDVLQKLLNYAIEMHPSNIPSDSEKKYVDYLKHVFDETVILLLHWLRIGFTHGVLNTDNMSLFGITIDYGPFGFMEEYNPNFIPNTSDHDGRYSYAEQKKVICWNLQRLVVAVSPLLNENDLQEILTVLQELPSSIDIKIEEMIDEKLGFEFPHSPNKELNALLLKLMKETRSDFTMTFRQIGLLSLDELSLPEAYEQYWCLKKMAKHENYNDFIQMYRQHVSQEGLSDSHRQRNILTRNPQYVLRNWIAQQAIEKAEKGEFSDLHFLLDILSDPYTVNEEAERRGFSGPPPSWSKSLKVSCSS